MKFSVIIPCRNASAWIETSLRSVADQTYPPFEIIVIDDGSTDDSIDVVRRCNSSAVLLHSNACNGAGTRNVGIDHAVGEWIAFLDADDIWYPEHLQRAVHLLQGTDDVGFLNWYDSFSDSDPNLRITKPVSLDIGEPTSGLSDARFFQNYATTGWFNMHGCIVNRERLLSVGKLDETQIRRHDIEMWLRVIHGKTWSFDPVPSTAYRRDTPHSISRHVADAAYYAFRAIRKNRHVFDEKTGKTVLERFARSAIASALVDGTEQEISRAYSEALTQLGFSDRLLFRTARTSPAIFGTLARLRRRLRNGN